MEVAMQESCVASVKPTQKPYAQSFQQSLLARYKTELCRSLEETGVCKYGPHCTFAHGVEELRSIPRHPKYRTKLCKKYHEKGLCEYGQRCCYVHDLKHKREEPLMESHESVAKAYRTSSPQYLLPEEPELCVSQTSSTSQTSSVSTVIVHFPLHVYGPEIVKVPRKTVAKPTELAEACGSSESSIKMKQQSSNAANISTKKPQTAPQTPKREVDPFPPLQKPPTRHLKQSSCQEENGFVKVTHKKNNHRINNTARTLADFIIAKEAKSRVQFENRWSVLDVATDKNKRSDKNKKSQCSENQKQTKNQNAAKGQQKDKVQMKSKAKITTKNQKQIQSEKAQKFESALAAKMKKSRF